MRKFGLIGKKLVHSFSKKYFTEKFTREGIQDAVYDLYELADIAELPALLAREPELVGLNVTVPYKEAVVPYLDELDPATARIGAVNTIRIRNGKKTGFNTDYIGFKTTLEKFYTPEPGARALILGTGGASKAVATALDDLHIAYRFVSRNPAADGLSYGELDRELLTAHKLIVNTTPLGTYPATDECPPLPYEYLTSEHYLYDLVYNPENTTFMQKGAAAGAHVLNGLGMLYQQADAAWAIWNNR